MSEQNPYSAPAERLSPPKSVPQRHERSPELELLAQQRIRIGVAVRLPGALLNCLALRIPDIFPAGGTMWLVPVAVAVGVSALLVATAVFLWFRGAALLMLVSVLFQFIFGRRTDRNGWINATLEGTRGFVPAMTAGGFIWLTYDLLLFGRPWSFIFYFLFGTLAHICGAVAYVPILVQWYRYRRESRATAALLA